MIDFKHLHPSNAPASVPVYTIRKALVHGIASCFAFTAVMYAVMYVGLVNATGGF